MISRDFLLISNKSAHSVKIRLILTKVSFATQREASSFFLFFFLAALSSSSFPDLSLLLLNHEVIRNINNELDTFL